MTAEGSMVLIQVIINISIFVTVFVGRNWLKARVERGVQHTFDRKIEAIRAELRESEERLKSELRSNEAKIAALRDGILSGRAQRQAIIDRRRLEAVERIWTRVSTSLSAYKTVATWMSMVKFDAVGKKTSTNEGFRKIFSAILVHIPGDDAKVNNVSAERIFISPLAWSYFSAYQSIMYISYARAKVLAVGIDDPIELMQPKPLAEVLKAALPHQAAYIDKYSVEGYANLLGELEEKIISELTIMLEGRQYDQAELEHSVQIIKDVNNATIEISKQIDKANTAIDSASTSA